MHSYQTRTVLVTGASRGIGYAVAELFARRGYVVYANYNRTAHTLDGLSQQLRREGYTLTPIQADVTKKDEVRRMAADIPGVDILVNNAGIAQWKPFVDLTEDDWDTVMAADLKSVYLCTHSFIGHMLHKKSGHIINLSSVWGVTGGACEVHYSAAKAGVIGFTKALAKEMGPSGIQVNCIAPGVIDTDMNAELTAEDRRRLCEETPLGKIGLPEQVARAALFLAEDAFITGEVLNINGGFHI